MSNRVYLDWNATTPLRPEAKTAMAEAWELCGNPSSVHAEGRRARRLVEEARNAVAAAVGAAPRNVIFTSGGTEANALALTPVWRGTDAPVKRLLMSAIEHPSVLAGGRFAVDAISKLPVTPDGVIDLEAFSARLAASGPSLVSVMAANNETGAIQPVREVADLAHKAGCLLHVDAVQAFGKMPLYFEEVGADLITLSAHKLGGPKGVGALVLADGISGAEPLLRGGGQERGRRAGTENVAGIAGFGAAIRVAMASLDAERARLQGLRDRLEAGLRQASEAIVFSQGVPRLPNTTLFTVRGLRAETAVIGFDLEGIAVSSGSACSSGRVEPSHVLKAMGVSSDLAQGAVRLSLGWSTTEADVESGLRAWRKLVRTLIRGSDETELERF